MKLRGTFYKTILATFFLSFSCCLSADPIVIGAFEKLCCEHDFMQQGFDEIDVIRTSTLKAVGKKEWTIILYVSADNDLAPFAIRNIKQMAQVGSNEHFTIVVQLDIRKTNGTKVTRRYRIEKGAIIHVNADDPDSQAMNSGDPETLISCCTWAINDYPADKYALVLWNHGSGILDPRRCRAPHLEELFHFNPRTHLLEIDRSIGYIERMLQRGICFDDSTKHYLSYQNLDYALDKICTNLIDGKFSVIAFDACLMQMVEIAHLVKNYAEVMVGSQEAGLGYGWNYADVLDPLKEGGVTVSTFAEHIVDSYERSYIRITSDYTMSAIDLAYVEKIERNINSVACLLMEGLRQQKNGLVKKTIKASRNKMVCTHFDEPSYIDLHHFYGNMLTNMDYIQLRSLKDNMLFKIQLEGLLEEGRKIIEEVVFACTSGKRIAFARGISIYFPEYSIHDSYRKNSFAEKNNWIKFLKQYLLL